MERETERKCARCGKNIYFGTLMVRTNYTYKLWKENNYHYYCGWNCFSQERREYEARKGGELI